MNAERSCNRSMPYGGVQADSPSYTRTLLIDIDRSPGIKSGYISKHWNSNGYSSQDNSISYLNKISIRRRGILIIVPYINTTLSYSMGMTLSR